MSKILPTLGLLAVLGAIPMQGYATTNPTLSGSGGSEPTCPNMNKSDRQNNPVTTQRKVASILNGKGGKNTSVNGSNHRSGKANPGTY